MEYETLKSYNLPVISLPKSHLRTLMGPNNYQEQNILSTVHALLTILHVSRIGSLTFCTMQIIQ